jgi:hypothetical protein
MSRREPRRGARSLLAAMTTMEGPRFSRKQPKQEPLITTTHNAKYKYFIHFYYTTMSSSPSSSSADLTSEAEAAKQELSACEKEISAIKSVLRTIGPSQQTTEEDNNDDPNKNNNTLKVYWVKVRIKERR